MSELTAVFSALADPSRRRVIASLAADADGTERACGSFDLPVGKATRTHHFRVLREAGLIDQRQHGNGSSVKLRRDAIEAKWPGLLDILTREPWCCAAGQTRRGDVTAAARDGG